MSYALRIISKDFGNFKEQRFSVGVVHRNNTKRFVPITIKNEVKRLDKFTGEVSDYSRKDFEKSTQKSKNRSLQLFDDLVKNNIDRFQYFATLTFDNKKVNRLNDDEVMDAYEKFINNLKHQFPNICYITVLERHKKDNAIHFHMILGDTSQEQLKLVDSGKRQKTGKNKGAIIYNCLAFKYGFTTITEIVDKKATMFYIKKYISKSVGGSTAKCKKRFYHSRNLTKPKVSKKEIIYNNKINLETLDLVKANNLNETITYYSQEKSFMVKTITNTSDEWWQGIEKLIPINSIYYDDYFKDLSKEDMIDEIYSQLSMISGQAQRNRLVGYLVELGVI